MSPERFRAITGQYGRLRLAVVGDFCLDRYLELDPSKQEVSIETGLPVYNVANVRAEPGGAGTVVNNLAALGVGTILPVGFVGDDGEGYELRRALAARTGVRLDHFIRTGDRHTFTYSKPLVIEPGKAPRELNRFDQKNWTPTPPALAERLSRACASLSKEVDAFVLLSQVHQIGTGVLTESMLQAFGEIVRADPQQLMLADSRHGLHGFPPVIFKMNAAELAALTGNSGSLGVTEIAAAAADLAGRNERPVFVTLAERGIVGAMPDGRTEHVAGLPVCGVIDIVGAGDAVTANLAVALAAGASLCESIELANAAGSVVIHQLGTTGTATVGQLGDLLVGSPSG